ncbi:hypothetical protein RYH80_06635 [Halobaculum sp. MBLA0147]|uniref:DUF7119 family protein n=1 Tax=Halobaculum sp. MBLA0147 TaxID=3079934 RepID=UPI003524D0EC
MTEPDGSLGDASVDEPPDRAAAVGDPVVRGDPDVTGSAAADAIGFDPDDEASLATAAETVRRFATQTVGAADNVVLLRGAAASAALVRGEGSYKAAAERAGDSVTVSFVRKWARVHDLPESVRRHVARGNIPPTAAKHVARVDGDARFALAWAVVDADLTVREVRRLASAINDGRDPEAALADHGVTPGRVTLDLPFETYRRLRVTASLEDRSPGEVVGEALAAYYTDQRRDRGRDGE